MLFGFPKVTVHSPISRQDGDLKIALYGSFLPVPSLDVFNTGPDDTKVLINIRLNTANG